MRVSIQSNEPAEGTRDFAVDLNWGRIFFMLLVIIFIMKARRDQQGPIVLAIERQ